MFYQGEIFSFTFAVNMKTIEQIQTNWSLPIFIGLKMFLNLSLRQIISFIGTWRSSFSFTLLFVIHPPLAVPLCFSLMWSDEHKSEIKTVFCKLYKHQSWKHKPWEQHLHENLPHCPQIHFLQGDVKSSFAGVRNVLKIDAFIVYFWKAE